MKLRNRDGTHNSGKHSWMEASLFKKVAWALLGKLSIGETWREKARSCLFMVELQYREHSVVIALNDHERSPWGNTMSICMRILGRCCDTCLASGDTDDEAKYGDRPVCLLYTSRCGYGKDNKKNWCSPWSPDKEQSTCHQTHGQL